MINTAMVNDQQLSSQLEAAYSKASSFYAAHQFDQALTAYNQAYRIAQEALDYAETAWSLDRISMVYTYDLNDYEQGINYARLALAVAVQAGDDELISTYLEELSASYAHAGQYRQALDCQQQAMSIGEELDDLTTQAHHTRQLGNIYRDMGNHSEAIASYERALQLCEEAGERDNWLILNSLVEIHTELGDSEKVAHYQALADETLRVTEEAEEAEA